MIHLKGALPGAVSRRAANKFASLGVQMNNPPHRSSTLATLRHMLLPKLLSGELSVGAGFATVEVSA